VDLGGEQSLQNLPETGVATLPQKKKTRALGFQLGPPVVRGEKDDWTSQKESYCPKKKEGDALNNFPCNKKTPEIRRKRRDETFPL